MSRKIYEQILRNSGEGFLKVNAQKDENGNYIDFDILDYNKSFVDILKKMLKKNNLDIDILKDIIKDKFKANPDLEQFYIEQIKALNDAIDLVQEEGLDLLKLTV